VSLREAIQDASVAVRDSDDGAVNDSGDPPVPLRLVRAQKESGCRWVLRSSADLSLQRPSHTVCRAGCVHVHCTEGQGLLHHRYDAAHHVQATAVRGDLRWMRSCTLTSTPLSM